MDGASYIINEVGIILNPVSVDGALYVTTEAGDITATDVDTSNDNVILTAAGNIVTEDINTNGTGATVTLNAGTGGTITDNGGVGIATGTLDITRALSVGALGATLDVNVDTLSIANVSGNAYVRESNTVDLNTVTVGGILDVTATAGNITATEINATGGGTTLTAEAGGIAAGDINAGAQTVTLDANGAITNIAGDIDAGILNITDAASVGTTLANLDTNVATLQMSKVDGGSYITNEVGIVLNPVSADGALYVTTEAGDITATDVDTSNDNVILTAAGNIVTEDINTNGTGATVTLNAGAGSTITDNGGAGIASGTLDITRALSVGASGAPLDVNIDTLNIANVSGGTYILETNGINLNTVTVGGILDVTSTAGDITATDVDTSNDNVTLTAAGSIVTEDINTNGTGATVTLNAGTGGTITDNGGSGIATGTLDITRALSVGALGATLDVNVDTLSIANVSSNAYVRESNTVDLNTVTVGGILDVTATAGDITATQVNATGGATTLTAEAGSIAAGDINAGVQTVTLDADGAITNIAGDIDAGTLRITDAATVGTALANLDTNVGTLQMSNVDGDSYIINEVGIVLNPGVSRWSPLCNDGGRRYNRHGC